MTGSRKRVWKEPEEETERSEMLLFQSLLINKNI